MKHIAIDRLIKAYGNKTVVDNLTLTINSGEFFALLGQNGAGKTTTIKMLCGLTIPTSGTAILHGDNVVDAPEKVKQKINISPQETAVAPLLTVRENLDFMAGIYGIPRQERTTQVDHLLETFHMQERQHDKARILSGGYQRRLSIAMALISHPEIVFLDEPGLGLDVRARRELWNTLKTLKGKTTVILTTHYMEEAEALADRIGIMHQGKLKALGTVAQLLAETSTTSLEDAYLMMTEDAR